MDAPQGSPRPQDGDPPASDTPRFSFPLPVDPVRLAAGVLSRWPWIALGALALGAAGAFVGAKLTHPHHTISVSLIKRRVPQTVQASEVGQAYRPVDLNDATLLATLLAHEPLDAALERAANGISPDRARSLVEAEQLEGTDIFHITYHSPLGPDDAIAFSGIWAEEINAYTQRLQQTEAREVRRILQKEVDEMQKRIDETNQELLEFSQSKDYLGGDAQVSAALAKLAQIELQLDEARADVEAREQQLANLTDEIRHQSPMDLQLKTARDELAQLRATYTDANPLVQAKLQSIEYLKEQVGKLDGGKMDDLESYTGTPLGNQLYLSIVEVRNDLAAASSKVESLQKLYQTTSSRIAEFPAIVTAYDALRDKRETLSDGLALMSNRLKETEIFASSAPGYWQMFQAPDPRSIQPSSSLKKPLAVGFAGASVGGGAVVLLLLLLTQRSARRSALECCATTRAPFVVQLPADDADGLAAAMRRFWITHLGRPASADADTLVWTHALAPDDERRFWQALGDCALADGRGEPLVRDLSPDGLWNDSAAPPTLRWETRGHGSGHRFLRASTLPHGPERDALAEVSRWFTAVTGDADYLTRAADGRALTDACLPPCNGTVAVIARPSGAFRRFADKISIFLAQRFSSPSAK
ncbi:MAG: hypothetical protein KDN05_10220 [Verrucomicrobiae bacterium]|nr:hypothetical protein [Verrucomicrobiae bacterium]